MKSLNSRKYLAIVVFVLVSTLAVHGAAPQEAAVRDVAFTSSADTVEFTIRSTGEARYTHFELDNPLRLVVDFEESRNGLPFTRRAVNRAGVTRVRTGTFSEGGYSATRIVFDLAQAAPYQVTNGEPGLLRVVFGSDAMESGTIVGQNVRSEGGESVESPVLVASEVPVTAAGSGIAPEQANVVAQAAVQESAPEQAQERIAVPVAESVPALPAGLSTPVALQAQVPPPDIRIFEDAPAASASSQAVAAQLAAAAVLPNLQLSAAPPPAPLLPQITGVPPATEPSVTLSPQSQQYTGEVINLDFRDVDLKDFFRLVGDISGLNIVLDPNVSGNLTLTMRAVPWDQALDVVLRNFQLGGQLQGNVLRIATNATLQREENQRRELRDAQDLAADLVTRTYILNYTQAGAVSTTLQRMLSQRGDIIQDTRRNALIVSDLPGQFSRIEQMIQFLDTPEQQVEIEARLLAANKSFSRELGNQLGFVFGNNSGNVLTGGAGASSPFDRTPEPRATSGGSGVPLAANFPAAATSGLAFLLQSGGDIILDEIITAAEARGTARLISRPKVTTQNNQPANVSQGTQIPVQTVVNNTISVQFLTFALSLSVTPQITEAGTILLTVQVENSQPDFASAVNGIPSVATQQATTQVLIPDGGTAGIAGILVDGDSLNVRQVPGLGSLPIIGHLFKHTQTIKSTNELMFFITARIKSPDAFQFVDLFEPEPVENE